MPILRLLLLRHAKSDWSDDVEDHERRLSPRGKKAAPKIGSYMRAKGYEPGLVLCSTARRTRETLELILPRLKSRPKLQYQHALYLADWPDLLAVIRKTKPVSPLLLVGHNPGMEQLAIALALNPKNPAERGRTEKLAQKFPTAALAVLDFDEKSWRSIKPGSGSLVDYARPKDLTDRVVGRKT
jgi:phosphohistidine phosphatase